MVLGDEATADAAVAEGRQLAWIQGMALRSEPAMAAGRDQVNPIAGQECVADVYARAGITNPIDEICLLSTSPSPRDRTRSLMPSSA